MATSSGTQQYKLKIKHSNPLFEKWLSEWMLEAQRKQSKMEYVFQIALKSLRKYPLRLNSGKECGILNGFGAKLCQMLDQRLAEHQQANPSPSNHHSPTKKISPKKSNTKKSNLKNDKKYIPAPRTGPHALLITLYQESQVDTYLGYMSKKDLCRKAEAFSDKSFVKPDPGTRYTAWSSMKTLLTKQLIHKEGNPAKFSLTPEGSALASFLLNIDDSENNENIANRSSEFLKSVENIATVDKIPAQASTLKLNQHKDYTEENGKILIVSDNETEEPNFQSLSQYDDIIFKPKSFQVILLVDTQETEGKKQQLNDATLQELKRLNVVHEVRNLNIGDFAWICRNNQNQELILPYIIERKRMDDLGASIKDGRFHEQKFRLKQSGIQNVIYLVESHGNNQHTGLPLETLYQAVANTWIQDGFNIKFTASHKCSMSYLAKLTKILKDIFLIKTLSGCSKEHLIPSSINDEVVPLMVFSEFNQESSKTKDLTVKELFITHLLQLKGISLEKAEAIVNKYPSPKLLLTAYENSDNIESENLLASIQYGPSKQKIGAVISRTIYKLYTKNIL